MTSRHRKTNRKNWSESNSDDDSDSETSGKRKSSRVDKRKQKYQKSLKTICDPDSDSDKNNRKLYNSRTNHSSKVTAGKTSYDIVELSSDSDKPNKKMPKQNKKDEKKRRREDVSSESSSEPPKKRNSSKKHNTRSSKPELSVSKSKDNRKNENLQNSSDSSSSKEFQEPKGKRTKDLRESFTKYKFDDYSNVNTPSRANEEKIPVELSQEIDFKHYVIQEIKKFQNVSSTLHDELECCRKYLLKKKIESVGDAKFFIHKILKHYEDTFVNLKENRNEFTKIYENWINELCKTSKEVKKKKSFDLSSNESDNGIEMPNGKDVSVNKLNNSRKPDENATLQKSKEQSSTHESENSDNSVDEKLAKAIAKTRKSSPNKSTETAKTGDVLSAIEHNDEPSPQVERQKSLKSKNSSVSDENKSVASQKASEGSEVDSPMQVSGCDSDAVFSSEEARAKKRSNIEKKKAEIKEKVNEKKGPVSPPAVAAAAAATSNTVDLSDSEEDLFGTSTGEVANTPILRRKSTSATGNVTPKDQDEVANTPILRRKSTSATVNVSPKDQDEVAKEKDKEEFTSTQVGEPLSASSPSAPSVESSKQPTEITDPKEREAFSKLKLLLSDDSDVEADSEPEDEPGETQELASTSARSSKGEAVHREKKKMLKKQTKKRSLISSASSSSDDGVGETTSKRRDRNKSAGGGGGGDGDGDGASAALRTAVPPRKKLDLSNNQYYQADEKLRQKCRVELKRLPKSELAKHARALEKSKNYVERKKIISLANLDNLETKKKSKKNAGSDEASGSNADNVKVPPKSKKNKPKKDEKMSLADHLGKKSQTDDDLSSDKEEQDESHTALTAGDDSLNQSSNHDAESKAKEALLRGSSSSDDFAENEMEVDDDSKKEKPSRGKNKKPTNEKENENENVNEKENESEKGNEKKKENDKEKENEKDSPTNVDSGEEEEEEADKKKEKSAWRRDKLLTFKLDGSDTEEEKFTKSQEKKKAKQSETENDKNTENDKSQEESSPCKKPKRTRKTRQRRILDSDSDVQSLSEDANGNSSSEESDKDPKEAKKKAKKRQRRAKSSDSDTSSNGKKQKNKRRRIKKVTSDSDSGEDKDSPGKGRKNIRKVLKDKYVTDDTRKAAQDEEERMKRIIERQKLFNDIHEKRLAGEEKVEKLVLDIDEETKEELVVVDEELAKKLKPHQARGIKFMWDACFESIEQIKTSEGSGCIVAHCMGLGKTFQVVALAHTLLSHAETGINTVMIVCPLSTVLNWHNEFTMWLKNVDNRDDIDIYELTKCKKNIERKYQLESWQKRGGVLIIGYEMFRNLTSTGKKKGKKMQESIMRSLVDPGADLVVCDEGHLLKNEDSALSKAMRLVKTMRRIVLTGTPLQNNLKEYHCMVQFVKPNLLGTKKEFLNRFVNPITNGQFDDSTPYDVKLMKKRAHVLHKMLEGSVQRFDYSVLTPFLPPKQEYVIFLRLTEVQKKLYQHYLDNFSRRFGGRNVSLFADFQALQRIWTHPYVLRLNAEKVEKANEKKRLEASDSEGSLKDFIDDGSTSASESNSSRSDGSNSDIQCLDSDNENGASAKRRGTRANPLKQEEEVEQVEETPEEAAWWSQFVEEDQFNDLRISTKLMLLFSILKESEKIGDKVLVFSQSLYSLTLIEHFLNLMDEQSQKGEDAENLDGFNGTWALGSDYFRLDGSTSAENRSIWSKIFNNPKNTRARLFLISTRAGGLGINLIGANRVIIFDASWNPSHDVQSIFRIYRFGQKKPCYVYRLLAAGTMEEKIYNRQVTKLSLACRVVDEQQIERHYSNTDLAELYQFDTCEEQTETLALPQDRMLAEIFIKYKEFIVKCHEHDSLLENKEEEELDEEERKLAWAEYEQEKKGIRQQGYNMGNNLAFNQMLMSMNAMPEFQGVKQLLQKDYPDVPPEHLDVLTRQAMFDMYRQADQQTVLSAMNNFRTPLTMPSQQAFANPTIQDEIFRQQNMMINQPQANYYPVNQMPSYSGRGRPPKFTSYNNQIVTNPMYLANNAQMQSQSSVPNDEVQVLTELPVTSSNRQPSSNANN